MQETNGMDDADAYKPGQKNCASKHDIELGISGLHKEKLYV